MSVRILRLGAALIAASLMSFPVVTWARGGGGGGHGGGGGGHGGGGHGGGHSGGHGGFGGHSSGHSGHSGMHHGGSGSSSGHSGGVHHSGTASAGTTRAASPVGTMPGHHGGTFVGSHAGIGHHAPVGTVHHGWHGHRHGYPYFGYGFGYGGWSLAALLNWPGGYGYGSYGYGYYGPGAYASSDPMVMGLPAGDVPGQDQSPGRFGNSLEANAGRFADAGETAFRAGDYQGAVYAWRHAVLDDPQNPVLVMLLGQGLFATGQFNEAAGATQAAMQMLPKDQWGVVVKNFREIYGNVPDYTTQLRTLEAAVAEYRENAALRFLAGFHYAYLGYPAFAIDQLDKGLKVEPRDEMAKQLRDEMQALLPKPVTPPASSGQPSTAPSTGGAVSRTLSAP